LFIWWRKVRGVVLGCFACPCFHKGKDRELSSPDGRIKWSHYLPRMTQCRNPNPHRSWAEIHLPSFLCLLLCSLPTQFATCVCGLRVAVLSLREGRVFNTRTASILSVQLS
jgi:hypothetical protein